MATILDLEAFAKAQVLPAVDTYGNPRDMAAFDGSGLVVSLNSLSFNDLDPTTTPNIISASSFNNWTSAQDSQVFVDSKTTTASASVSVTIGVTLGVGFSTSVGIPLVGSDTLNLTVNASFSTTTTQTTTTSQTWSWSTSINIPAWSSIHASVVVQNASYSTPFSAKIRAVGQMRWGYQKTIGNEFERYGVWWSVGQLSENTLTQQ